MRLTLILCCLTTMLSAQVKTYLDVAYDNDPEVETNLLSLDVYVPDGPDVKPLAMYVHGGGWAIGDKKVFHEKMKLFTELGYIFVSINYRLSPFPYELDNPDRIMYPEHPKDVAKAISYVLDRAETYGGDLDNVFLFGHSAGAHLAVTVATDEQFLEVHGHSPREFKCVCSLDTGGFDLQSWIEDNSPSPDIFINAFGSDTAVWEMASPINNIPNEGYYPDLLLVYQSNFKRILSNQQFAKEVETKTSATVSAISTTYKHDELNQLLGNIETQESTSYTDSVIDWLGSCMTRQIVSSTDHSSKPVDLAYPNPTSDFIKVDHHGAYSLYSVDGSLVRRWVVETASTILSLDGTKAGNYILTRGNESQKLVIID